jgi:hypothetical protein
MPLIIVKIGAVKAVIYVTKRMEILLVFSIFLWIFTRSVHIYRPIWVKTGTILAHNHLWVSCKSEQGRTHLSYGTEWNYICACTLNPYAILKVNNTLVNSVLNVTECVCVCVCGEKLTRSATVQSKLKRQFTTKIHILWKEVCIIVSCCWKCIPKEWNISKRKLKCPTNPNNL